MIDNINNNALPEGSLNTHQGVSGVSHRLKKDASSLAANLKKSGTQIDDSLQIRFDTLIEKAKQPIAPDNTAVQRARELLLSGKLDTVDNIHQAAENIVKLGI
jgi:hypothetical protein